MEKIYAICGAAFFLAATAIMAAFGNHAVHVMLVLALLLGAIGQFLAQDGHPSVTNAALVFCYAGMLMGVVAMVTFAVT